MRFIPPFTSAVKIVVNYEILLVFIEKPLSKSGWGPRTTNTRIRQIAFFYGCMPVCRLRNFSWIVLSIWGGCVALRMAGQSTQKIRKKFLSQHLLPSETELGNSQSFRFAGEMIEKEVRQAE
jgi:hypothetical protein